MAKENKLLRKKKESTVNRKTKEEIARKREFHRVIDKIRNLPKPNEANRTEPSQLRQTQPEEDRIEIAALEPAKTEVMSSYSKNRIAITFKRHLGANSVRYII